MSEQEAKALATAPGAEDAKGVETIKENPTEAAKEAVAEIGEKRKAEDVPEGEEADKKAKTEETPVDKGKGKSTEEPAEAEAEEEEEDEDEDDTPIVTGKRNRTKVNYADPKAWENADLDPTAADEDDDDAEVDAPESPDDDEDGGDYDEEAAEEEDDEDDDDEEK
ncbi:hypothetical protein V866_000338 [Kwoniella sp. B9012]